MGAPHRFETDRLIFAAPTDDDAEAVLDRYASDPEVTRYLGWPRHQTISDTRGFLAFSAASWDRWSAGPYLIRSRSDGRVMGSTGLDFEQPDLASTGYVLAQDAWGQGYATEALQAMVDLAGHLVVARVYALCHPDHRASQRVLEKCGFTRDASWSRQVIFPNLAPDLPQEALCFQRVLVAPETCPKG